MPAAPVSPRTDLDFEYFRRQLEDERTRLITHIRKIDESEETGGTSGETSELADYDQHMADQGTELFMREADLAIHDSLDGQLDQVEAALKKLQNGTYGYCDRCGMEIMKERLEVLPSAIYCIPCSDDIGSQY